MTINNHFPYGTPEDDPRAYGLPSAGEIARIAAAYFPEFDSRGAELPTLDAPAANDRLCEKSVIAGLRLGCDCASLRSSRNL